MTRTPDEIKKGLECCARVGCCHTCPYDEECHSSHDDACPMHMDALALIQQLEVDNSQLRNYIRLLQTERDSAVKDMCEAQSIVCLICKNYYQPDPAVKKYGCKVLGEHFGEGSIFCGMFEWRGVQKEDSNA